MKLKGKILTGLLFASLAFSSISLSIALSNNTAVEVNAIYTPSTTYTTGDAATYYNSIDSSLDGNTLLTKLRELNLSKRKSTVSYSTMGTSASNSAYIYTDYDPATVRTDSKGQPYGTSILSFYSGKSTTSWNREHVWPNSRGGGDGGSAGTPYPDADIFMPRPTITEENSDRGNSKYVEGMCDQANGWDPVTAFEKTLGVYTNIRGECARIIFYCMTVNSKLVLDDTATGGTKGVTMGKLSDLLKWNLEYSVNQREKNRNEGGEYLQGNRNAFVDHPEYACKIWGDYNTVTKQICGSQKTVTSITVSPTTKTLAKDSTQQLTVTAHYDDNTTGDVTSSATYSTSSASVASVSNSGLITSNATSGTATITATYNGKSATCVVTATAPTPTNLTGVTASNVTTKVGETATIVPTPQPSNAYPKPTYSYSSNNTGIATVNNSGVVTGVTEGSTTIIVTATQNSIVKTCNVSVTVNPAQSNATISYTDLATAYESEDTLHTSAIGGFKFKTKNCANFSGKMQFKANSGYLYSTESSNLNKITIKSPSGDSLSVLGCNSAGTTGTTISGSNNVYDLSNFKYFCIKAGSKVSYCDSIDIDFGSSPSPVDPTVSLNKTSLSLAVGASETLTATTTGTGTLSWSSNNNNVATVSNGKVTAVAAGSATITATYGGATATCNVTVTSTPTTWSGVTIQKSNSQLSTTALSSETTKTYTLVNDQGTSIGKTMQVKWSKGCLNNNQYDEFTVPKSTGYIRGLKDVYVKSITADLYQFNNITIYSGTNEVTGVEQTPSSQSKSLVLKYEINNFDWEIKNLNSDYAQNIYSLTFEVDTTKEPTYEVSLNKNSLTLNVDATETLIATATGAVTWESSDTSKATVDSNGKVTAIAEGNATITAKCGTASAKCAVTIIQSVTPSGDTYDITFNTVSTESGTELTSTTFFDQIASGSEYASSFSDISKAYAGKSGIKIGSGKANGSFTMTTTSTMQTKNVVSITLSTEVYGSDSGSIVLSVNGASIKSNITPSDKTTKIQLASPTKVQNITIATTANRAYIAGISFEIEGGSSEYNAESFASDFLINVTCDPTGQTTPALNKTWAELKTLYLSITSVEEKNKLINATYTVTGSGASTIVTATGTTTNTVAQAMYKYDYIVAKYSYTPFIDGRTISAPVRGLANKEQSNETISALVIGVIAGLTGIGAFFFIRKRKEN